MTGNQDKGAAAAAWVEAGRERLMAACDQVMDAITATRVEPNDSLGAARQVRAIELLAKTMPKVAGMCLLDKIDSADKARRVSKQAGSGAGQDSTEDHMNDNERDDSPENLERLRAELESRLARLHDVLEQKCLDEDADGG